jgi:hypothetical protein
MIDKELKVITKNKTLDPVTLPTDRKAIGSKWDFKSKASENVEKQFEVRLVARGFTQVQGVSDVLGPVANSTTIRLFFT